MTCMVDGLSLDTFTMRDSNALLQRRLLAKSLLPRLLNCTKPEHPKKQAS